MTAPDTSVLVAGFDSSHPFHEHTQVALSEVRRSGRLVAHTIAETFAVLTAVGPYALPGATVLAYLDRFLDRDPIGLEPAVYGRAMAELADAGLVGGSVYDALIAVGARDAGATLISLDRRAAATYRRCRAPFELMLP
ncbi:MAG: PIN domain-containing protein [Solirubrobacteraceae bacterium]